MWDLRSSLKWNLEWIPGQKLFEMTIGYKKYVSAQELSTNIANFTWISWPARLEIAQIVS